MSLVRLGESSVVAPGGGQGSRESDTFKSMGAQWHVHEPRESHASRSGPSGTQRASLSGQYGCVAGVGGPTARPQSDEVGLRLTSGFILRMLRRECRLTARWYSTAPQGCSQHLLAVAGSRSAIMISDSDPSARGGQPWPPGSQVHSLGDRQYEVGTRAITLSGAAWKHKTTARCNSVASRSWHEAECACSSQPHIEGSRSH